jgi:hypothetical protein
MSSDFLGQFDFNYESLWPNCSGDSEHSEGSLSTKGTTDIRNSICNVNNTLQLIIQSCCAVSLIPTFRTNESVTEISPTVEVQM